MNRDEIIRIAKDAGLNESGIFGVIGIDDFLEKFANLVVAAERKRIAKEFDSVVAAIRARGQ